MAATSLDEPGRGRFADGRLHPSGEHRGACAAMSPSGCIYMRNIEFIWRIYYNFRRRGAREEIMIKSRLHMAALSAAITLLCGVGDAAACNSNWCTLGSRGFAMTCGISICPAARYDVAAANCHAYGGRICTYEDFSYVFLTSNWELFYNTQGKWIGNMINDDEVFCGNRAITFNGDADIYNFEGHCNKSNLRQYWCCFGPTVR
jgi:hypothetical protein